MAVIKTKRQASYNHVAAKTCSRGRNCARGCEGYKTFGVNPECNSVVVESLRAGETLYT